MKTKGRALVSCLLCDKILLDDKEIRRFLSKRGGIARHMRKFLGNKATNALMRRKDDEFVAAWIKAEVLKHLAIKHPKFSFSKFPKIKKSARGWIVVQKAIMFDWEGLKEFGVTEE